MNRPRPESSDAVRGMWRDQESLWKQPFRHYSVMLEELAGSADGEPAAWLNSQGAVKVAAGDYWSNVENKYNLYHAWAYNFRLGAPHNYPESFEPHVWPYRNPAAPNEVNPAPALMVNGERGKVTLVQGEALLLEQPPSKM